MSEALANNEPKRTRFVANKRPSYLQKAHGDQKYVPIHLRSDNYRTTPRAREMLKQKHDAKSMTPKVGNENKPEGTRSAKKRLQCNDRKMTPQELALARPPKRGHSFGTKHTRTPGSQTPLSGLPPITSRNLQNQMRRSSIASDKNLASQGPQPDIKRSRTPNPETPTSRVASATRKSLKNRPHRLDIQKPFKKDETPKSTTLPKPKRSLPNHTHNIGGARKTNQQKDDTPKIEHKPAIKKSLPKPYGVRPGHEKGSVESLESYRRRETPVWAAMHGHHVQNGNVSRQPSSVKGGLGIQKRRGTYEPPSTPNKFKKVRKVLRPPSKQVLRFPQQRNNVRGAYQFSDRKRLEKCGSTRKNLLPSFDQGEGDAQTHYEAHKSPWMKLPPGTMLKTPSPKKTSFNAPTPPAPEKSVHDLAASETSTQEILDSQMSSPTILEDTSEPSPENNFVDDSLQETQLTIPDEEHEEQEHEMDETTETVTEIAVNAPAPPTPEKSVHDLAVSSTSAQEILDVQMSAPAIGEDSNEPSPDNNFVDDPMREAKLMILDKVHEEQEHEVDETKEIITEIVDGAPTPPAPEKSVNDLAVSSTSAQEILDSQRSSPTIVEDTSEPSPENNFADDQIQEPQLTISDEKHEEQEHEVEETRETITEIAIAEDEKMSIVDEIIPEEAEELVVGESKESTSTEPMVVEDFGNERMESVPAIINEDEAAGLVHIESRAEKVEESISDEVVAVEDSHSPPFNDNNIEETRAPSIQEVVIERKEPEVIPEERKEEAIEIDEQQETDPMLTEIVPKEEEDLSPMECVSETTKELTGDKSREPTEYETEEPREPKPEQLDVNAEMGNDTKKTRRKAPKVESAKLDPRSWQEKKSKETHPHGNKNMDKWKTKNNKKNKNKNKGNSKKGRRKGKRR